MVCLEVRLKLTVLLQSVAPSVALPRSFSLPFPVLPSAYLFNFILIIAQAEQANRRRARVSPPQQQLFLHYSRTVRDDTLGTGRRRRRRELGTSGKKGIALGTKYLATQNSLVVLKSLRDDIFFPCFDLSDHENEGLRELVRGGPPSLD